MAKLIVPNGIEIKGGFLVTYKGSPNKCVYWEVVGVSGASETTAVGQLIDNITVTDANGFSVNRYVASTNPSDAGKTERIKASESA